MLDSLVPWIDAAKGQYGTVGLFALAQHAFIAFGLIGGAGSWLISKLTLASDPSSNRRCGAGS